MALLRDQQYKDALNARSSFVSVEKTLEAVVRRLMSNERLKRLLYYSDPHALGLPRLTPAQSQSLLGESILIVPKIKADLDTKPYIIINLDRFVPNPGQTDFRQVLLSIDILCAYDQWNLGDFKLRPYVIAGEIDGMINNSSFSSGVADFAGAKQLVLNEHLGGVSLYYNLETFGDDKAPLVADEELERLINGAAR